MQIERYGLHTPPAGGFSQAVRGRDLVALAGQAAVGPAGEVVGSTITEQAAYCFANIDTLLHAAGSDREHVLRLTTYLTAADQYNDYNAEKRRWLGDASPAGTVIIVAGLLIPGLLLEIEVLAVVAETS